MNHILSGLSSWGCTGLTAAEAAPDPQDGKVLSLTLLPSSIGKPEEPVLPAEQSVQTRASGDSHLGPPGTNSQVKERKQSPES